MPPGAGSLALTATWWNENLVGSVAKGESVANPVPALDDAQRGLLDLWLGEWRVVEDLSWPHGIATLRLRSAGGDSIVKASTASHHIGREIDAYRFLGDRFAGRIPRFVHGDVESRILLLDYLEGDLAQGTDAEWDPAVYEQAGRFLAELQIPGAVSDSYLSDLIAKAGRYLDAADGMIPDDHARALRTRLEAITAAPVRLSFTHGDWQARNWLVHEGELRVIDFGRGEQRHGTHDLVRLETQQFLSKPELRAAFYRGFGGEPVGGDARWLAVEELFAAVATVPWARQFGDPGFEEHGREMIRRIVERDRT